LLDPDALPATAPTLPEPRSTLRRAAVRGIGIALPPKTVSAAEVAERIGVDEHWIMKRMGVAQRHIAEPDDRLEDLAAQAGRRALADAGVAAEDLDLVIVGTFTGTDLLANSAAVVAADLGARRAGAFDISAACASFLSGLATATGLVESRRLEHVLVIGADLLSHHTDPHDYRTAPLLGDGAGAAVVGPATGDAAIHEIVLRSNGEHTALVHQSRGGRIEMEGQTTFAIAVDELTAITGEILDRARLTLDDVDVFVFHQANARILRAVALRLGLDPRDPRLLNYVHMTGNTSAASTLLALDMARAEGRLEPGARMLLASIGAGYVWGAALFDWACAS
jgi:3-oxoacyl-[acyl-carrier-protein] synthase-3